MILEMKVPSPGESITEVEIATWLVKDGDYVEKDQVIAEVDSDKATLELPAEESGTITLKAEEGDAVDVGQVVCLIDTSAEKPEGAEKDSKEEQAPKAEVQKPMKAEAETTTYATGSASPAAKKILAEKGIATSEVKGTGKDGRVGGDTVKHCKNDFFFLKVDDLAVKGKTVGIEIYTVLNLNKDKYVKPSQMHNDMHMNYQKQDFDKAIKICNDLMECFEGRMANYYDKWIERCEYMKTQKLPKDWDGIFIATTK